MDREFVDFLVIGSGVAGLRAAIEMAAYGDVLVVTKDVPTESSTEYAQGGIAVALSDEDRVGIHLEDTLLAGDGLCRENAVRALVGEGPDRINELIEWGAEFDREGLKLAFTREAAHSKNRILHAHGDSTGKELERVLLNKVRACPSIRKYPFAYTLDLIVSEGVCLGVKALKDGRVQNLYSKATLLATGGAGQLFERTTNPAVATADGMAMAFRAGATLEDMEFVQFHPTSLYLAGAPNFLLSEAMRGEGAVLRNINKETFMKNYHPMAELAPRDVVSRAIISEMVKTESLHVYLDLTHLDKSFLKKRFPTIYSTCLMYKIDLTEDLVPVSPAAHYIMGGIKTDLHGATDIKGLYAAGEVACTGVHGANRLASNSLLEGLVFGARTGRAAAAYGMQNSEDANFTKVRYLMPADQERMTGERVQGSESGLNIIRNSLRKIMWERVGIIRCGESLNNAKAILTEWRSIPDIGLSSKIGLELKNMLTVALLITESALDRKGSVGAHYRSDYKERGESWQKHLTISKDDSGYKKCIIP